MANIKNIKELTEFVLDIGNGISESLKDGKVSFNDAFEFKDAVFSALPAFKGLSEVDDEFLDLDEAEMLELKAFIANKLSLDANHKSIELIAEAAINVILESHNLIAELTDAKKPA